MNKLFELAMLLFQLLETTQLSYCSCCSCEQEFGFHSHTFFVRTPIERTLTHLP